MIQNFKKVGSWFNIQKDGINYNVFIQGDGYDYDPSSVIVLDNDFNKVEVDMNDFESLMDSIDFKYMLLNTTDIIFLTDNDTEEVIFLESHEYFTSEYGCLMNSPYKNCCLHMIEVPIFDWKKGQVTKDNVKQYKKLYENSHW